MNDILLLLPKGTIIKLPTGEYAELSSPTILIEIL